MTFTVYFFSFVLNGSSSKNIQRSVNFMFIDNSNTIYKKYTFLVCHFVLSNGKVSFLITCPLSVAVCRR